MQNDNIYRTSSIQALTITNKNLNLNSSVQPNNEQLELPLLYTFLLLQNPSNLINLVEQNSQLGLPSSYLFSLLQNNLINPAKQNSNSAINISEPSFSSNTIPVSSISDSDINIPESSSSSIAMLVFGISDSVIANTVFGISDSVIEMPASANMMVKYEDIVVIDVNIRASIEVKRRQLLKSSAIHVPNIVDAHDPIANKFNITNRTFTEPMLANIELWTNKGNFNMRTQRQLLEAKYESAIKTYPSVIITDNGLAIDTAIANIIPNIYYIFYIGQNLLKNLKSKLGSDFNNFSNAWYKMRNTLSLSEFDCLWDSFFKQYPSTILYLSRVFGSQKERCALSYTSRIFTAGAQFTQRVESQNAIIKSTINSNTSILELVKKIDIQFNHNIQDRESDDFNNSDNSNDSDDSNDSSNSNDPGDSNDP
ncbi:12609_t:CDS:2, partial [Dentiscutata erythropus]